MITVTIKSDKQGEGKSTLAREIFDGEFCSKRIPYTRRTPFITLVDGEEKIKKGYLKSNRPDSKDIVVRIIVKQVGGK